MSQRLHGCVNNTNFDKVHIDSYTNKLANKNVSKRNIRSPNRERNSSIPRGNTVPSINLPSQGKKPGMQLPSPDNTISSIIRKEIFDAGCVEVTVKTHPAPSSVPPNSVRPRSRSRSTTNYDTWSKILKNPIHTTTEEPHPSQFNCFDPLRTLHFLAKELQSKISDTLPYETSLHQMVMDMQQALNRVPPEVSSTVQGQQVPETTTAPTAKKSSASIKATKTKKPYPPNKEIMVAEKLVEKPTPIDRSCQTMKSINLLETERLHKHLEESTEKIELFCKQMETVCTRLKNEKLEVEEQLKNEKEITKKLKETIEQLEKQKGTMTETITKLTVEKDDLILENRKIKAQLTAETGPSSEDLRMLMQDLRLQKAETEQEILTLKHELTVMTMSKEKYVALLAMRDNQITEIKNELNQLQNDVSHQVNDIQKFELSSAPSSVSNITALPDPSWAYMNRAKKEVKHEEGDAPTVQDIYVNEKNNALREPSGDSSGNFSVLKEMQKNGTINKLEGTPRLVCKKFPKPKIFYDKMLDSHPNVREMFEQIAKQAFSVQLTSSSETTPYSVESYANEAPVKK